MKDLWGTIFRTSAAKIYNITLSIVSLIITARLLGPEGRGIIVAILSWSSFLAILNSLSLGQVSQYYIQTHKKSNWISPLFGSLVFLTAILSLISLVIAIMIYIFTAGKAFGGIKNSLLMFGIIMVPFCIWEQYGSYLLMSIGQLKLYNIAQIAGRTFNVITIVIFVYFIQLGVTGALLATILGQIIISLVGINRLWHLAGSKILIEKSLIRSLLSGAGRLHLNTVGALLLSQVNILLLNYYSTKAVVGLYQFSFQLITIMLVIPQAVSMVLFSKMAGLTPDSLWKSQKKIILQIMGFMILIAILAYWIAPFVILLLAGERFQDSIAIFRQLLPVVVGMSLAHLMTTQWIGRGKFLLASIITIISAVLNIVFGIILIPVYGMQGAVWTSLISFAFFATIVQLVFAVWCDKKSKQTTITRL